MLSGKDKLGPACINAGNLAQAAPIDFSYYSKSRISLGREPIWDIGKNARQNLSLSSSQSPSVLPTARVYYYFAFPMREKGNNVSWNRPNYKSTSPKIITEASKFSNLSPYNSGSPRNHEGFQTKP
jgi:hypothetical protein